MAREEPIGLPQPRMAVPSRTVSTTTTGTQNLDHVTALATR